MMMNDSASEPALNTPPSIYYLRALAWGDLIVSLIAAFVIRTNWPSVDLLAVGLIAFQGFLGCAFLLVIALIAETLIEIRSMLKTGQGGTV